jgi:hypothetical protein
MGPGRHPRLPARQEAGPCCPSVTPAIVAQLDPYEEHERDTLRSTDRQQLGHRSLLALRVVLLVVGSAVGWWLVGIGLASFIPLAGLDRAGLLPVAGPAPQDAALQRGRTLCRSTTSSRATSAGGPVSR